MSKLTLDIPDSLHRAVKSFSSGRGVSMKDFFIEAAMDKMKDFSEASENKPKKSLKKKKKSGKYITEKEADKMLKPYLLRMIKRIDNGEEDLMSWDEFKTELEKD